MIKLFLLLTFLFLCPGRAFSMQGIKVLEVSTSGSSMVVDRGSLEGVRETQTGRFYYQSGDLLNPKLQYIGTAEVIKAHEKISFWYFRNKENSPYLKRGQTLRFVRDTVTLNGRRKYKIREHKTLLPRAKSLSEYVDDRGRGMPSEMVYKEDEYKEGVQVPGPAPTVDFDIKQRKYLGWKKRGNPEFSENYLDEIETLFIDQTEKGVKPDAIRAAIDKEIAKSTTQGAVEKVNAQKYGLNSLYRDSKPSRSDNPNTFEEVMKSRGNHQVSEQAKERIKRRGGRWSADMEDEQLRRYFIKTGLAEEQERQKRALTERAGHEINFKITSDMNEVTDSTDINNNGMGYSVNLTYEIPLRGASTFLDSFSFELGMEQGNTFYSVSDFANVRLKHGNFRGFMNWYFLNEPISIQSFIGYVGMGIARGNGTILSPELSSEYKVSTLSLPIIQGGLKYRFKAGDTDNEFVKVGLGLGLSFSYEPTKYSILDTLSVDDNINPDVTINRLKIAFGLSAYF